MNKIVMIVAAGLISTSAIAVDHTDPLGTGAMNSSNLDWVQVSKDYRAKHFSIDHNDPIGAGALEANEVVYDLGDESGTTVSQPEIGDSSSEDDFFNLYETSDVL